MKTLVIAPRSSAVNLFKTYRKDNPFSDAKFLTKEDFISMCSYSYTSEAIVYLIEHYDFDYNLATKFLKEMRFIISGDTHKIKRALDIKNDLIQKGLLVINEYASYELEKSDIKIHNYSKNDPEILYFLKKYNYEFVEEDRNKPLEISEFEDYDDELFNLVNEIAHLVNDGVSPNDIYIYGLNNEINLTLLRLLKNYGINLNGYSYESLFDLSFVKEFIDKINNENFDEILSDLNDRYQNHLSYQRFDSVIRSYRSSTLSIDRQIELFINVLKKTKSVTPNYKTAIRVTNEPFVPSGSHLFIVNMTAGSFPSVKKDDGYFFKSDLEGINYPSLEERNAAISELYISSLYQNAKLHLSYSLKKKDTHTLSSHLVKQLKMKIIKNPFTNAIFSYKEAQIKYALALDIKRNYRKETDLYLALKNHINIPYRNYDNKFKGTEHYIGYQTIELSYSKVKEYYSCAFKYYLNYILKLDSGETSFPLIFGNISHKIFEDIDSGLSFDVLFNKYVKQYEEDLSAKDMVFLEIRKPHLEYVFNYIKEMEGTIYNPQIKREDSLKVKLTDNILLVGKIDKSILSGKNQENITIIDYKSGQEEFKENHIEYGLSIQLPTYIYLLKSFPAFMDKDILGLFIEPIFNQKGATMELGSDEYCKYIQLKGVFNDNVEKIATLDPTILDGKSQYITGASIQADRKTFKQNGTPRFKNEKWFNEIKDITEKLYIDAGNNILNNRFDINPKLEKGKNLSCSYCSFRDICYRKNADFIVLKEGEEEEDSGD